METSGECCRPEKFDGDVAKGLGDDDCGRCGQGGGNEADIAVGQREGRGIFAFDGVDDIGGAKRDEEVVVAVPVRQSFGMRSKVDVEDADLIVGKDKVMVGLGGDFDFWRGLRGKERGQKQDEEAAFHGGILASRRREAGSSLRSERPE